MGTPIDDQDFIDNPDWPESFKNHFESLSSAEQQNVFVDCQGRYPADKDALKDLKYYPENQAFPTNYFPYEGESKSIKTSKSVYHSPLVAIQIWMSPMLDSLSILSAELTTRVLFMRPSPRRD